MINWILYPLVLAAASLNGAPDESQVCQALGQLRLGSPPSLNQLRPRTARENSMEVDSSEMMIDTPWPTFNQPMQNQQSQEHSINPQPMYGSHVF